MSFSARYTVRSILVLVSDNSLFIGTLATLSVLLVNSVVEALSQLAVVLDPVRLIHAGTVAQLAMPSTMSTVICALPIRGLLSSLTF